MVLSVKGKRREVRGLNHWRRGGDLVTKRLAKNKRGPGRGGVPTEETFRKEERDDRAPYARMEREKNRPGQEITGEKKYRGRGKGGEFRRDRKFFRVINWGL